MFLTIYFSKNEQEKTREGWKLPGVAHFFFENIYSLKRGSPAAYASADRAKVTEHKS